MWLTFEEIDGISKIMIEAYSSLNIIGQRYAYDLLFMLKSLYDFGFVGS